MAFFGRDDYGISSKPPKVFFKLVLWPVEEILYPVTGEMIDKSEKEMAQRVRKKVDRIRQQDSEVMITYEEALKMAKEQEPEIDNPTEYENGFVFGCSKQEKSYSSKYPPVVIRKRDGQRLKMQEFLGEGTGEFRSQLGRFSLT